MPFWVGGAAIRLFVVLLAWVTGKGLGVSTGYGSVCSMLSGLSFFRQKPYTERWRLWFLAGIPLGGFVSAALSGDWQPKLHIGIFESVFGDSLALKAAILIGGGFLIGFGARWAGGWTSGHSILGVAQGAKSSMIVTAAFMAAGVLVTQLVFAIFGGGLR